MKYRREIDGLRALAVMPVILFHTGFIVISGGFVGVDIFFVISGFLITTIIINEMECESFSLINFYERRARRILPALFVVITCSLFWAWFSIPPDAFKDFGKSLIAVSFFSSNFLFVLTSAYFDIRSELKPLLHTWSLAVEEQYYLIFPIFLLYLRLVSKRIIVVILLNIIIISIILAEWGSRKYPIISFYLLPTRGFEILIGSVLAMIMNINGKNILKNQIINEYASLSGLILVIYSIFAFDSKTPWPSLYTLIPTIGAGLIIFFSSEKNLVGNLLANKFLVGTGLISYSAYLWHQPIIAFSKNRSLSGNEEVNSLLIITSTIILAYFTWQFIEKPFRNIKIISSKFILYFSIIGTLFFSVTGLLIYKSNGFRNDDGRIPPNIKWFSLSEKLDIIGDLCIPKPYNQSGISLCEFGDINSKRNIILYGDSHAQAISEELNKYFLKNNIKGYKILLNECEVVPEMRLYLNDKTDITDKCLHNFSEMLSFIKIQNAEIIISSRWTFKVYPIEGHVDQMPTRNSEGGVENETYREYVSVNKGKISFASPQNPDSSWDSIF